MHAQRLTQTSHHTHRRAHTEKWHVDQPNLTRKIQHVLQLWDSYWFLVHHLIDFTFLRVQIDGDSRGFLMGLNPDVCLAVSKGLSVLCALITHKRLSPAAPLFGGFVQRGYRDKRKDFSKSQRPIISQGELQAWIIRVYDMISLNLVKYSMPFTQETPSKMQLLLDQCSPLKHVLW